MVPKLFAPGSRVEVRDAEWRIKRVDQTSDNNYLLSCDGLSELVSGREAYFLTSLEKNIRILQPEDTQLVDDDSDSYRASRLYIDTLMRRSVPQDAKVYVGWQAAMDVIAYQLEPAYQALSQPRARILIADSVGLGKTLEAGILTSELIARGRGKRILVLAVKSMLSQFQQEFWSRFSIGLTRLDSHGLQRVRHRIPSNHNPFHYFDRSIISIDTLKQDKVYRHYLEQAYWDIIIIDEAHNVAERSSHSQRAQLAKLLATRSDTLIMLSATPHDGKPESFASLMNMLDPTAIADASDYAQEDFKDKGLVIRRFKDDVRDQLGGSFPEREISTIKTPASVAEEHLYELLAQSQFKTLKGTGAGQLFRTTLTKALFSSPAALLSMIANRQQRLAKRLQQDPSQADLRHDLDQLNALEDSAKAIRPAQFSKYQQVVRLLNGQDEAGQAFGWKPKDSADRLVLFTESIPTLSFLAQHLPKDCNLRANQVAVLRGDMRDSEITELIEQFNNLNSPLRLLLCSDVASEGINLHHLSHRLVHFDIPWSLMVFQQRNGRIDRYGQTQTPQIRYLLTESQNPKIRGDNCILEVLIEKDTQAGKNIGDPSEFSQEEGEERTAQFIERNEAAVQANAEAELDLASLFADFLDDNSQSSTDSLEAFIPDNMGRSLEEMRGRQSRLYAKDMDYAQTALRWLQQEKHVDLQVDLQPNTIRLTANEAIRQRRNQFPREAWPADNRFVLSSDVKVINESLQQERDEDSAWSTVQYLWPLHPVMEWLEDRVLSAFGRHTAPIIRLPQQLTSDEHWVLLQGGYPNRRGQMHLQLWCAVQIQAGQVVNSCSLPRFLELLNVEQWVNPAYSADDQAQLQQLLPVAIEHAKAQFEVQRQQYESSSNQRLNQQMSELDRLKARHVEHVQLTMDQLQIPERQRLRRKEDQLEHINRVFDDYLHWLENTQLIEKIPYLQVVALFTGQVLHKG